MYYRSISINPSEIQCDAVGKANNNSYCRWSIMAVMPLLPCLLQLLYVPTIL